MTRVFSVGAPILKLADLKTTSERDFQTGYMRIMEGCMIGVRNPRAHAHGYLDEPRTALELLATRNHLVRTLGRAKRTRRRGAPGAAT